MHKSYSFSLSVFDFAFVWFYMLWHFNCFRGSLPFYPDIIEMPDKIKGWDESQTIKMEKPKEETWQSRAKTDLTYNYRSWIEFDTTDGHAKQVQKHMDQTELGSETGTPFEKFEKECVSLLFDKKSMLSKANKTTYLKKVW